MSSVFWAGVGAGSEAPSLKARGPRSVPQSLAAESWAYREGRPHPSLRVPQPREPSGGPGSGEPTPQRGGARAPDVLESLGVFTQVPGSEVGLALSVQKAKQMTK